MRRLITVVAACLLLAGCGGGPADDAAQAACRAYGDNPTTGAQRSQLRATTTDQAQRAAEADDSYAAMGRDIADAWSRSDAMAAAQRSGQPVGGEELDAYVASDERVRADCADAGADLGPLRP